MSDEPLLPPETRTAAPAPDPLLRELAEKHAQLQTSEALKAAIVDNALAALVSTDAAGCIVEFNPSAEAMFGRTRAAVLGRTVGELLVPPRLRERHDAGMRRAMSGGAARVLGQRLEMSALRADGNEFPIDIVLWRTDVQGRTFYTASIVDATERHQAAQQIERQRDALRQSERLAAMGSLLAGVAHELNNPLSILLGRAGLLEEKCSDDQLRGDVQSIREAAERCARIVHTFLDMARRKPAVRKNVALNDVVRAALEMLRYSYRSHGIEVELALDDTLPPVLADADQIGQIVLNLLVNAQQSLDGVRGVRRVSVQTGLQAAADGTTTRIFVRIADSGPGVPEAMAMRIFDPLFTTRSDGSGTGMGLTMSRALARDHGGELELEATGGAGGASFCLALPAAGSAERRSLVGPAAVPAAPMLARILVVDDETEIADLMREMLERAGYEVATAESGAVALELLAAARFDAIVSDLRMPDMDGAQLYREVQRRHRDLARRILFVTGDTLSPDAHRFLHAACCRSLDKPFAKADLLAGVARLLE